MGDELTAGGWWLVTGDCWLFSCEYLMPSLVRFEEWKFSGFARWARGLAVTLDRRHPTTYTAVAATTSA